MFNFKTDHFIVLCIYMYFIVIFKLFIYFFILNVIIGEGFQTCNWIWLLLWDVYWRLTYVGIHRRGIIMHYLYVELLFNFDHVVVILDGCKSHPSLLFDTPEKFSLHSLLVSTHILTFVCSYWLHRWYTKNSY